MGQKAYFVNGEKVEDFDESRTLPWDSVRDIEEVLYPITSFIDMVGILVRQGSDQVDPNWIHAVGEASLRVARADLEKFATAVNDHMGLKNMGVILKDSHSFHPHSGEAVAVVVEEKMSNGSTEKEFDPVGDLMNISCSLSYLSDSLDDKYEYGLAKLLNNLCEEVSEIANRMEHEEWEGPSEEELEARRQERMKNSGPDTNAPLKSDDEAIAMLQEVFAEDEKQAASIKGIIDISHHYLKKRQADGAQEEE